MTVSNLYAPSLRKDTNKMEIFDKQLQDLVSKVHRKIEAVPALVAETAVEHFQNAILKKEWDGVPYEPYKKKKQPNRGSLMYRTGNLFRTIRPSLVELDKVVISAGSSRVPYAKVHNEGGLIKKKERIAVLNFKKYKRGKFKGKTLFSTLDDAHYSQKTRIGAHSYNMTKRQFMGKSNALIREIETRFKTNFKTI